MSRSYPIWNDVKACIYSSSKSYGARDTSECAVRVGTSKSNSELLCTHVTTRREHGGAWTVYTFGVDVPGKGLEILARKYMHNKTREWSDTDPLAEPGQGAQS